MLIKTIDLPREFKAIYVIPISDLHLGDPHVNFDKFYGYRKWIEDTPNAYVLLNGDLMNTATKGSVSNCYEESIRPSEQLKLAVKLFEPIKDRILAIVTGNHERRIQRDVDYDPSELLAGQLGVYYGGDEAFLKIRFGSQNRTTKKPHCYTVYATHGWAGGRTPGAKANSLQKLSDIVLADIYISSHVHTMVCYQDILLVPDLQNNKMMERKRTFASSGAFLTRGGYAVQKGYPQSKLGSVRLRLDGVRHDVHVSI
jgi:hypothetical protein